MVCIKLLFCVLLHVTLTTSTAIRGSLNTFRSVCYDDLGCYARRPGSLTSPESPQKVNTRFYLYARNRPGQVKQIATFDLGSVNVTKPIKVIIHGFNDGAHNKWVTNMANELLKSEDMNVIAVDWSGGNGFPYEQAVANTVIAAAVTRQLLQAIIDLGAKPQQIHLIGHSLGAHISSYIGRDLPNLGRISGLDPAGPEFYSSDIPDRLDASDALFVDVIHTDGASNILSGFGHLDALGHVDFYPNGGSAQPSKFSDTEINKQKMYVPSIACASNTGDVLLGSVWDLVSTWNVENAVDTVACNHNAAILYYTDSINTPTPAYGYPCSDYDSFVEGMCTSCGPNGTQCQRVGYHASPDRSLGTLYMMTIDGVKAPHFGFHFTVVLQSPAYNDEYTRGIFKMTFNEQSEEKLLFDQYTFMRRDTSNSKTILVTNNPSPLKSISISFQKTYDVYFGIGFADKWSFNLITIYDMQSNTKYTFCPQSTSLSTIQSGSSRTYELCV